MLKLSENPKNGYLRAFLFGLLTSFVIFIPFILLDSGYFLYYGDFNVQQVPFYQMCHDAVRSGNVKWSWTTDLGANFIGSYSFYLIGSPFFWLTLPFPSQAVPYLMGPLLMLKFACASLAGYTYLQRYIQVRDYAVLGGLLYAFSGYSVYNVFFNHFHEAIIVFPFLLWALDEYMEKRRRGVFALLVFASCFVNYYFFVGQVVFCVLYFFARVLFGNWRLSVRDFLLLFAEAVMGVLLSCVLLIPTVLCVVQNPRVDNPPEGWGALLYSFNQRYLHILQAFFFPPDIPARPNFTPDSEAKWASLGAWLPLFSMTGVIAFLQNRKKSWLKCLIPVLFLMAFVPILNSAFQMFNSSYYARWFYMLTLLMIFATLRALENPRTNWKRSILWTVGITLGIALPIGLMPHTEKTGDTETLVFGLEEYPVRFWAYVAIALLSLLLLVIVLKYWPAHRAHAARRAGDSEGVEAAGTPAATQRFASMCLCMTVLVSILYSLYLISLGKTQSDENHIHMIPYSLNQGKDFNLPGVQNSRMDVYDGLDNQCMFFQFPTMQAFHSIVPGSIMEFYPSVGVTRDVGSRADTKPYGLRGLLSCRWLIDPVNTGKKFVESSEHGSGTPRMPGWSYYGEQNGFDVWENQYYIPLGFCYDSYITRAEYDAAAKDDRNLLLLKTMVLDETQAEKFGDILTHYDLTTLVDYSEEAYFEDCKARKLTAAREFSRDNDGFTATIGTASERLVFFSVPYEQGWSATVNGQPAEIEKVNVGFMAVRVPAGENEIRFDYKTPGLRLGALVSACAALLLALYLFLARRAERTASRIETALPESEPPVTQNEEPEKAVQKRRLHRVVKVRTLRVHRASQEEIRTNSEDKSELS